MDDDLPCFFLMVQFFLCTQMMQNAKQSSLKINTMDAVLTFNPDFLRLELKRGGVLYDPGCGGMVGSDWRIKIKMLPGHNPVQIKVNTPSCSTMSDTSVKNGHEKVPSNLLQL